MLDNALGAHHKGSGAQQVVVGRVGSKAGGVSVAGGQLKGFFIDAEHVLPGPLGAAQILASVLDPQLEGQGGADGNPFGDGACV